MKLKSQKLMIMKTITTFLFALLLTASAAFGNGKENEKASQIEMFQVENGQFRLIYALEEAGKVKIAFYDESGRLVDTDRVKNEEGFLRKYDMTHLPNGTYSMKISSTSGEYTKDFQIGKVSQLIASNND
jgi:flagellar hook assembly protein FlgD